MSEESTGTSTEAEAEGTETSTDEVFDKDRALEKIRKLNSEAKNLRSRVKALEPLEAKAREAEESKLSETERYAAQIAEAQTRAERAEVALLRFQVARTAGLPDDLVDRLRGDTEEELLADAKTLAKLIPPAAEVKPTSARRSDPSQGSDPMPLNGDPLEQALKNAVGAR